MQLWEPGEPDELRARVAVQFRDAFGNPPALVGRAPGRVNLIGEHTDYNQGLCLPVALPHATYAALATRADDRLRLVSDRSERSWQGTLSEVGPGSPPGWPAYVAGVLWALDQDGFEVPGLDVALHSTVPVGSGLSSSAALECAVAVGVARLTGCDLDDDRVRQRLVAACIRAETEVAGAPTGGMDQTVSLFANEGAALLLDFADGTRHDVPLGLAEAGLRLLVIDTTVSHALTDGGYAARRTDCETAAAALGLPSLRAATLEQVDQLTDPRVRRRARHVVSEIQRVTAAVAAFGRHDWNILGRLFAESHASLRDDFEVSCDELDVAVETALTSGARGARMTGGGFGGSAIALVDHDRLDSVGDSVTAAFARAGYAAPRLLLGQPSARAE